LHLRNLLILYYNFHQALYLKASSLGALFHLFASILLC
jgi:hypothetical protein